MPRETISGRIVGRPAMRLAVRDGDGTRDIDFRGASFATVVALRPGLNEVRVLAMDAHGVTTDEVITVERVLPPPTDTLVITTPADGYVLPADAAPAVVVEGRVEDPSLVAVRLAANQHTLSAPVVEGRFRAVMPMLAPVLQIHAEAPSTDGPPRRSRPVTVHAQQPFRDAVLVLDRPAEGEGLQTAVTVTWRSNPARPDPRPRALALKPIASTSDGTPARVFHLPNPATGVYTFTLDYENRRPTRFLGATLYLPGDGGLRARSLRTVPVGGRGSAVLGRVLLPYGVLWDQDEWFTGQSASGDTVTKFRFPEGVSWTERVTEVPR